MRFGTRIVEQVDSEGNIIEDYDTSLSSSELYNRALTYFTKIKRNSDGMICGEYKGNKYALRIKNVTYLGHPHPHFKKRIQIPGDLKKFYKSAVSLGMQPILLGIYTYKDNTLLCDFSIDDFINKKANNSSAHVYTSDLSDATNYGYFQKTDYFGNQITVFKPEILDTFLNELLIEGRMSHNTYKPEVKNTNVEEPATFTSEIFEQIETINQSDGVEKRAVEYAKRFFPQEVEEKIDQFFKEENKEWKGVKCYTEMISDNYRNKYQSEWAGFYLEYKFEKFINQNNITSLIRYEQDKSKSGIDLDLFFPTIESYGDLKAHSENSRGIQGNDCNTIFSILERTKMSNHIFYIVCEHRTVKDKECGYVVTKFWNRAQCKKDEMSYSKRMKNKVILKRWMILDINPGNKKYLTMFKQGVNSNGKPRPPKIMIEKDNLKEFIIAEVEL